MASNDLILCPWLFAAAAVTDNRLFDPINRNSTISLNFQINSSWPVNSVILSFNVYAVPLNQRRAESFTAYNLCICCRISLNICGRSMMLKNANFHIAQCIFIEWLFLIRNNNFTVWFVILLENIYFTY